MKIIAKKDNLFLVTKDDTVDLSCIFDDGFIVDNKGRTLSPVLPIGTLTKDGYWESFIGDYDEYIKPDNNYVQNALIGAAVGDAYGVPYEFMSREEISKLDLGEMIGSDVNHNFVSRWGREIPSGSWSDDTSMTVATMDSMVEKEAIDFNDIMKKYITWWNTGAYSSLKFPFGLGGTISKSLSRYVRGSEPIKCGGNDIMDNGNGSLMRILPFSLYCIMNGLSNDETYEIIMNGSSITHAHEISVMACMIYTKFLAGAIKYRNPVMAYDEISTFDYEKYFSESTINEFGDLLEKYFKLDIEEIGETGYVVDSLKAAIYSVMMGTSYESTIKKCIRIGYDTDTNSCIAGSIAGVIYGMENIPEKWTQKLKRKEYLEEIANKFQSIITNIKRNDSYEK